MITSAFKHELAEYAAGRITKVSLNSGAYEITDFLVKQADNSTVTLNYMIPLGSVAAVNRVEVKSSTGTISDNAVTLPVTTDTLIVQVISVEE